MRWSIPPSSVFLCAFSWLFEILSEKATMSDVDSLIAQQLAELASRLQEQRTGHAPRAVTVVLSEDTLVVTMHEALTLAEKLLARTTHGAAQVEDFHRQLFADSTAELRQEILRITGRRVREAAAEVEIATGTVVHAFTTGAIVHVFLMQPGMTVRTATGRFPIERTNDNGTYTPPVTETLPGRI
jgi:uncharacterized protein YbcI